MAKSTGDQRATLQQIADSTQVSVAAVSYVLNGKPGVSDKKRREIEQLLEQSGLKPKYLRNPAFYIVKESTFAHLGSFTPFFEKYKGLNEGAHDLGMSLRPEFVNTDGKKDLDTQLKDLLSYKPGGAILDSDLGDTLEPIAKAFMEHDLPVVQIGHKVTVENVDAVVIDDFNGAYTATRHLISCGHSKIATIRWNVSGDSASGRKHSGFCLAMQEAGLEVRPEYVVESPRGRTEHDLPGRVAVGQLLALPDPPTAVFVENSFISTPLLYPVESSEVEVPAAIAKLDMVHFEAWHLGFVEQVMHGMLRYPTRRTKMMQVNWCQMGRVAAKQLVDLLLRSHSGHEVIRLAPQLMRVEGVCVSPL